jgi:hypothetical protein
VKLISIAKMVLREQDQEEGDESQSSAEVFQFPHDNMTISVFRNKKVLAFIPQFHQSLTTTIRTFITTLKQNFMVLRVTPKDMSAFEVEFDPRQNFDEVVEYVKQAAEHQASKK